MKKTGLIIIIMLMVLIIGATLVACNAIVDYTLKFEVDGTTYHTLKTSGGTAISMPQDPEKEGYTFGGWFWDKDVWNQELTVNSLLEAPISSNMTVYAKWETENEQNNRTILKAPEIYQKVNPSVCFILVIGVDSDISSGSGVFIDNNGTFVTNYHVIENAYAASIKTSSGDVATVDYVKGIDIINDLAILKADITSVAATIGNSDQVQVGETAYAIGYPEAFTIGADDSTYTSGMISRINYNIGTCDYLQTTASITHGNSGGAFINSYGEIIGITTGTLNIQGVDYMNLAIPSNRINNISQTINEDLSVYFRQNYPCYVSFYSDDIRKDIRSVEYNQKMTPYLPTKNGYIFCGWFTSTDYDQIFDFNKSLNNNYSVYAKWEKISITKNIDEAGTVPSVSSTTYVSGNTYTITAETNPGYTWLGWYDGDTKVSTGNSLGYTFTMPTESKTYQARWGDYNITLTRNITAAGTVPSVSSTTYVSGNTYTITAETNPGYTWLGWYDGDTKVSTGTSLAYTFIMPSISKTYTAKWIQVTLTKNISSAGSVGGLTNAYNVGDSATITATTNAGYTWLGWYDGDTKVSTGTSLTYTFTMPSESKTYTAKWKAYEGTVSFDSNGGTGTMSSLDITLAEALPANIFTRTDYYFVGWSLTEDGAIEYPDKAWYIVSEDGLDCILYAQWADSIEGVIEMLGYYRTGNYILFGEYPQTIKDDSVMVGTVADGDGYYSGSDGERYAKVTASPYQSSYKFSTDATVTSGTVCYFKVEPIKWRILSESDGTALILCESIIANKRFDDSSNNYMNSEIRAWLNGEFYNKAFTALQQELIQITNVDNPYTCENTNDKIFLPSYREMVNTSYGFSSNSSVYNTARRRLTSDYSRATGAYMNTGTSYYGNGNWWLRSPFGSDSNYARYVISGGNFDYSGGGITLANVHIANRGVVPALKISLS